MEFVSNIKQWWVNFDKDNEREGLTRKSCITKAVIINVAAFAIVKCLLNSDKWEKRLPTKPEY